jgi:hypothetical protein
MLGGVDLGLADEVRGEAECDIPGVHMSKCSSALCS